MRSPRSPELAGLEAIQAFFEQPPIQHLGLELAVCWILECLLDHDSYPTALMHDLSDAHPKLRLSETVLQQAIQLSGSAGGDQQLRPALPQPWPPPPHASPAGGASRLSPGPDAAVAAVA